MTQDSDLTAYDDKTFQDNLNIPIDCFEYQAAWIPGKVLADKYIIERMLGQGGMGSVYLVRAKSYKKVYYAVKTILASRLSDEKQKRTFLRELRTWIDLPEHPNLAECLFFRTIEDRLAIFAEYISGGSLQQWIQKTQTRKLIDILDIAIQFAYGLQAAHEHGVIHQDIKPGNVLLTENFIVKVTDFGLAYAMQKSGFDSASISDPAKSVLVSSSGMTLAYCSPEQAAGQKLNYKTDMWSWGLSVIEMFIGRVNWRLGFAANVVLDEYLDSKPEGCIPIPDILVNVLRKCFQPVLSDRWESMDQIAMELKGIYQLLTGKPYPRDKPKPGSSKSEEKIVHERRAITGTAWDDPVKWLKQAYAAAGKDKAEMAEHIPERKGSRKAQMIVDLEIFEESIRIYSKLISKGHIEFERELTTVLANKGLLQKDIDDYPGALSAYTEVIKICQRRLQRNKQPKIQNQMAGYYMDKALVLDAIGKKEEALVELNKTIKIREQLCIKEGRYEFYHQLAKSYTNKSNLLGESGKNRKSLEFCEKSIAIREKLFRKDKNSNVALWLSDDYMNKAISLGYLGESQTAIEFFDKSIELMNFLIHRSGFTQYARDLAVKLMNKALTCSFMSDYKNAVKLYDEAINIYNSLIGLSKSSTMLFELARTYLNKANALWFLGDHRTAVSINSEAIEIMERLVDREGRIDLADKLALLYMNKALSMTKINKNKAAQEFFNKSIDILDHLVHKEKRIDLIKDLALVYVNTGSSLLELKQTENSLSLCEKAILIMEKFIHRIGTEDIFLLAHAYSVKAKTLYKVKDHKQALASYDKALEIISQLVDDENRVELKGDLAMTQIDKARVLWGSQNKDMAKRLVGQAVSTLRSEVERTKRADLTEALHNAVNDFKSIL